MMNTTTWIGNWNVTKGKLKQAYGNLTEDDLVFIAGAEDELLGRLQLKLGKTRQEILSQLDKMNQKTL